MGINGGRDKILLNNIPNYLRFVCSGMFRRALRITVKGLLVFYHSQTALVLFYRLL